MVVSSQSSHGLSLGISFDWDTKQIGLVLKPTASSQFSHLLKTPSTNTVTFWVPGGYEFGGDTIQPLTLLKVMPQQNCGIPLHISLKTFAGI